VLFDIRKKEVLRTGLDGRRRRTSNKVRSSSPGKTNTLLCESNSGVPPLSSVILPREVLPFGLSSRMRGVIDQGVLESMKSDKEKAQYKDVGFSRYRSGAGSAKEESVRRIWL